ncbi:MAG: hypothetical protein L0228_01790 [Planctomycetes bacterium]|nr:hypothetical protein [Planctomycetota bacterium]
MGSGREQRALDALIVSQLRACDETDVNHLPELIDDEREALDSLGPDFVDKLLAGEIAPAAEAPSEEPELAAAGEAFGMNRAKDIDKNTKEELDRKRQEIIDRIKQMEDKDGQSGG